MPKEPPPMPKEPPPMPKEPPPPPLPKQPPPTSPNPPPLPPTPPPVRHPPIVSHLVAPSQSGGPIREATYTRGPGKCRWFERSKGGPKGKGKGKGRGKGKGANGFGKGRVKGDGEAAGGGNFRPDPYVYPSDGPRPAGKWVWVWHTGDQDPPLTPTVSSKPPEPHTPACPVPNRRVCRWPEWMGHALNLGFTSTSTSTVSIQELLNQARPGRPWKILPPKAASSTSPRTVYAYTPRSAPTGGPAPWAGSRPGAKVQFQLSTSPVLQATQPHNKAPLPPRSILKPPTHEPSPPATTPPRSTPSPPPPRGVLKVGIPACYACSCHNLDLLQVSTLLVGPGGPTAAFFCVAQLLYFFCGAWRPNCYTFWWRLVAQVLCFLVRLQRPKLDFPTFCGQSCLWGGRGG
mmetsp:Transcript_113018/g.196217  ORF Transcript_113018/g.196217 Transcript_113018/m.196217 type:complete len:402 (-) Transcript_113018:150-1355(-)